jgi:hypothetical protein
MNIQIIDNVIPEHTRQEVWSYLKDQLWHFRYKQDNSYDSFVPSTDGIDYRRDPKSAHGTMMARATLACDVKFLELKHKIIFDLWNSINNALGNKYEITGYPEGMPSYDAPGFGPKTAIPGLLPGWRVYTNAQYQEDIKHSHGIHRDTPDLNDPDTVTILYVANTEWYPSWFSEIVYYSDTPSGDTQQFQASDIDAQRRNFDLGWAQEIVSPVPGRIICYDGRTLHTTRPAALWAKEPRVTLAFRARLASK